MNRQVGHAGELEAHKKVQEIYQRQVDALKKVENLINEITRSQQTSDGRKLDLLRHIDRYKEFKLRVSFMRRLVQQFDSYYRGQPLTEFTIKRLGVMAEHESKGIEPNHNMTLFILGCKDVLIKKPSYNTKPLELLLKFMNYTSITKIKTSSRFYEEQDYSNGSETFEANKIRPDEIGQLVEGKIESSVKTLEEYEKELFENAPQVDPATAAPVLTAPPQVAPKLEAPKKAFTESKPAREKNEPPAPVITFPPKPVSETLVVPINPQKRPSAKVETKKRIETENKPEDNSIMDGKAFKKLFPAE